MHTCIYICVFLCGVESYPYQACAFHHMYMYIYGIAQTCAGIDSSIHPNIMYNRTSRWYSSPGPAGFALAGTAKAGWRRTGHERRAAATPHDNNAASGSNKRVRDLLSSVPLWGP